MSFQLNFKATALVDLTPDDDVDGPTIPKGTSITVGLPCGFGPNNRVLYDVSAKIKGETIQTCALENEFQKLKRECND
jgi:hypothetical protein